MVLPAPAAPLEGFRHGELIYLRTTIRLPDLLLSSQGPIAFQSLYIWAKRYEMFVNGRLIDEGATDTVLATIPRSLIPVDGRLTLAFRIDPGDLPYQGITHRGELVVGPKSILKNAAFQSAEIKTTYYLWFLIPKLIFLLIFCVLYAAVFQHREVLYFIFYGFLAACSDYVKTDYSAELFHSVAREGRVLYLVFDLCAQATLLLFVHEYFRRHSPAIRTALRALAGLAVLVSAAYLASNEIQRLMLGKNWIYMTRETFRCAALAYGTFEGIVACLYLGKTGKSRFRLVASLLMSWFFSVSLVFAAAQYLGFNPTDSHGIVALIFDLMFFLAISFVVAAEFGVAVTQKNIIKGAFGRFLDPSLVDRIMVTGSAIAPENRQITVFFMDIRSFTLISEVFPADDVFEMLLEFREAMVRVVTEYGGFVEKFGGDGLMGYWGAPMRRPDHCERAVEAALAMRLELRRLNESRRSRGQFEIATGLGLSVGPAIVGEMRSAGKAEYTAIGDTVNLASRVESHNKEVGTDILMTETVLEQVADRALIEYCGEVKVRGKEHPVKLYKLVGLFDPEGRFSCHEPSWDSLHLNELSPGIVVGVPPNLRIPDYKGQLPSRGEPQSNESAPLDLAAFRARKIIQTSIPARGRKKTKR